MPVDLDNEPFSLAPALHCCCCHFPNTAWNWNWVCFGTLFGPSNSRERKQNRLLESTKMKEETMTKILQS